MTLLQGSATSDLLVRGPSLADFDFSVSASMVEEIITPGTGTPSTVKDANIITGTSATIDRHWRIEPQFLADFDLDQATITNFDPSIGTLGADNIVRRVTNGTARIRVRTPLITKGVDVALARVGGATTVALDTFVSGSLARHCSDAIDEAIAGKTQAAWTMFSVRNTAAGVYERNPSAWTDDIDLTCVAANTPATLITPRHVYGVEHFPPGSTVHFVTNGNVTVTRTIISSTNIGPANASDSYATDIFIGRLDSDVPGTITPAKVLPSGSIAGKIPGLSYGVPCLAFNQFRQAMVYAWYSDNVIAGQFVGLIIPAVAQRAVFHTSLVAYDSGSPVFLIINNEPVLLMGWTFSAGPLGGGGVDIRQHATAINAAITSLGGGGSLSIADLSGFPTYP